MSIALPRIALGLEIPNPTFSIPGESIDDAAGWSISGETESHGFHLVSDVDSGHSRGQYIERSSSGDVTILSAPAIPFLGCVVAATKFSAWVLHKCSASTTRLAQISFYNSSDTLLGSSPYSIGSITNSTSAWNIDVLESASITPPTGSHHVRFSLKLNGSSGCHIYLRFAELGIWRSSTSGYQQLSDYIQAGSWTALADEITDQTNALGQRLHNDRNRYAHPHLGEIACDRISHDDRRHYARAHRFGIGSPAESQEGSNPGGGRFPLLLAPGHPSMLEMGLWDWEDRAFPLRAVDPWVRDYPNGYFSGRIRLRERV